MILISHRGNVNGKIIEYENKPDYIDYAIKLGFNVEIDVWVIYDKIFLGHDYPETEISINWLNNRKSVLWVHCKNVESICFFKKIKSDLNFFWHENDRLTLTSHGYMWSFPNKNTIPNTISVLPELFSNSDISNCIGVCSDNIVKYK